MIHAYTSLLVAGAACFCALPASVWLARRWNAYDLPGPLKIHSHPIPRIGGVGMMVGLIAAALTAGPHILRQHTLPLLAFALVWSACLIDDLRSLPSLARLAIHCLAGSLFWIGGWRLHWTSISAVDLPVTCLFVAFIVNTMNLLDGMDGLAAAVAASASLGFAGLFARRGNDFSSALAWTVLGVCLGVLTVNFPPAIVFMGDSGSTLLGVTLAFLTLDWARSQTTSLGIAPALMFVALPLADVGVAILRRLGTRSSPFGGDRRHFYDLLLQRGWSVGWILASSLGVTGAFVVIGWVCARNPSATPYAILIVVLTLASGAHFLGSLRSAEPDRTTQLERAAALPSIVE